MTTTPFLTNYLIRDIPVHRFCHLLEGVYQVLEREYPPKKNDPLHKNVLMAYKGLSEEQYKEQEKARDRHDDLADNIAMLHYDLASCFSGWYRRGKYSDIAKEDDSMLIVWNNPFVVQRTSPKQLLEYKIRGTRVFTVGFDKADEFENLSVREAYHLLSGTYSFYDNLQDTLIYIFTHFKTHAELIQEIS
jgi:hypothetical protein